MAAKSNNYVREMKLFLPGANIFRFEVVQVKPKAGSTYIWDYGNASNKYTFKDCKSDGYLFYQDGKKKFLYNNELAYRYYFKLRITNGKNPEFSNAFVKSAFTCDKVFPHQVLLFYEGDDSAAVDLPHGNNRREIPRPHVRNMQWVKDRIVEETSVPDATPVIVYNTLLKEAPEDPLRQSVEAPRDLPQVQSLMKLARAETFLLRDDIYRLYAFSVETRFLSEYRLKPELFVLCFKNSKSS